jgi:4-methyl-5(b-hydroxyethyl)-thiazole monophosphate biosynthesis
MHNVLVYLAPGFEEIEAVTIIDLLRRAEINVTVAGLEKGSIEGSHGISILADVNYDEINPDDYNYLILPGGQPGTDNLKSNQKVLEAVRKFRNENKLIGAICAAPTVLHAAGILENKKVTSYPSEKEVLTSSRYEDSPVVKDDNIVTSRGVGTAIDFALDLIEEIKGKGVKEEIANKILYKIKK